MSGLAGAGNKTRNYQQQKQLQYLLDSTWYKIYISNKFMEIIFLIFLTKNHLCSTAWSKGNLVLLVNNFQRSIVFLPCPCVSPSIDPWVTEAWNQYIHAQLELDRSWWISPSIRITDFRLEPWWTHLQECTNMKIQEWKNTNTISLSAWCACCRKRLSSRFVWLTRPAVGCRGGSVQKVFNPTGTSTADTS